MQVLDGAGRQEGPRRLRNDDIILQTCLYYARQGRVAGSARVFLLSNDRGLELRSSVNGVDCMSAQHFPRSRRDLDKVPWGCGAVDEVQGGRRGAGRGQNIVRPVGDRG